MLAVQQQQAMHAKEGAYSQRDIGSERCKKEPTLKKREQEKEQDEERSSNHYKARPQKAASLTSCLGSTQCPEPNVLHVS